MPPEQGYDQLASGKPMASMGIQVGRFQKKIKYGLVALNSGVFHLIFLALPEKAVMVRFGVVECFF